MVELLRVERLADLGNKVRLAAPEHGPRGQAASCPWAATQPRGDRPAPDVALR